MIRIAVGFDYREAVAYHTFIQSILSNTKEQVSFIPIRGEQRDGTNSFTYARFLVPYICEFKGWCIFADADMTCLADISELWNLRDDRYAVQVVKHDYQTKFPVKYWNQPNRDYPRKNWSSLVLWNCRHDAHKRLMPEQVRMMSGDYLHRFQWLRNDEIGELPPAWNHLALEQDYSPDAKLIHHTIALPCDPIADGDPWEGDWLDYRNQVMRYAP